MTTIAAGNSDTIFFPLAGTITVTPAASARFGCSSPASVSPAPRIIYEETSINVPAGSFVFIESLGGDVTFTSTARVTSADGGVYALSEAASVQALTATGTAFSGACEYAGFHVRAISGTPQTITVYDATSATGTAIHTESVSATGFYPWASGFRRVNSTGCHVVISGGTSRTIDVLVE